MSSTRSVRRELHPDSGAGEPLYRLAIERLSSFPVAQQRPRAGVDAERPVGATGACHLREPAQAVGGEIGLPAPGDGLDQLWLDQHPGWDPDLKRVLSGPLRRGERQVVAAQGVTEHGGRPVNECQALSLAPAHELPCGGLDGLGGLGFAALEGGQCQRGVRCEVRSGRLLTAATSHRRLADNHCQAWPRLRWAQASEATALFDAVGIRLKELPITPRGS